MESLHERTEKLIKKLQSQNNPAVQAGSIGSYVADVLRDEQISLYAAYSLYVEKLSLERMSYTQPAWGWYGKTYTRSLLDILNLKMLSILFQNESGAKMLEEWGKEAYKMYQGARKTHYIMGDYLSFLTAENDPVYLKRLLKMRERKNKPFDNGPYHDEVFPYDYCNYESLLLAGERLEPQPLGEEVERLLVELYVMLDD